MDGKFRKGEQEWHIWGSVCAAKCEFPGDLMAPLPVGEAGELLPFSKGATNRKLIPGPEKTFLISSQAFQILAWV